MKINQKYLFWLSFISSLLYIILRVVILGSLWIEALYSAGFSFLIMRVLIPKLSELDIIKIQKDSNKSKPVLLDHIYRNLNLKRPTKPVGEKGMDHQC